MSFSNDIDSAVDAAASVATSATPSETPKEPQTSTTTQAATPVSRIGESALASPSPSPRVPGKNPTPTAKPASAIASPVSPDQPTPAVPKESYPSEDKWPAVLDNARKKEAARIESEEYGVPLTEWKSTWKPHFDVLRTQGPVAYHKALGDQLRQRGLLPADSPSQPAQTAQPVATQPTAPNEQPRPDLRAEDGRLAYSAEQMEKFMQWKFGQFEEKLNGRFKPVEEMTGKVRETEMRSQASEAARAQLTEAESWPDFSELKPEIHRLMREDGRRTLQSAYIEASKAHRPQVTSKIREGILKELQSTPAAPNTMSPSRVAAQVNGNGKVKGRLSLDQTLDREIRARMSE